MLINTLPRALLSAAPPRCVKPVDRSAMTGVSDNARPLMDDEPLPPPEPRPQRAVRSYVLRAGRMGSGQERALAELGPRFVLPFAPEVLAYPAVFGLAKP